MIGQGWLLSSSLNSTQQSSHIWEDQLPFSVSIQSSPATYQQINTNNPLLSLLFVRLQINSLNDPSSGSSGWHDWMVGGIALIGVISRILSIITFDKDYTKLNIANITSFYFGLSRALLLIATLILTNCFQCDCLPLYGLDNFLTIFALSRSRYELLVQYVVITRCSILKITWSKAQIKILSSNKKHTHYLFHK